MLGCLLGGTLITQVVASERVQQVRLDLGEVGKNRDVAVEDDAEFAAGGGGVLLGQQDHRGRLADLAGAGLPAVEGGQSSPRLPGHPEPGLGGDRPRNDAGSQPVLADHEHLHLPGGGELLQRPVAVAARRLQNCRGKAHQQPDAGDLVQFSFPAGERGQSTSERTSARYIPLVDAAIRSGILCLVHASVMAREPVPWMFLARR